MSCQAVLRVLRDEFRWRNFGFNYPHDYVFYSSQWMMPRWLFLIYRLLVGAFSLGTIIYSIVDSVIADYYLPWPVYLTYWSYFVLTCHLVLAAIIAVFNFGVMKNGEQEIPLINAEPAWDIHGDIDAPYFVGNSNQMLYPQHKTQRIPTHSTSFFPETSAWYLLLDWILFEVSATAAFLVTITYFVSVYEPPGISNSDLLVHIMNSILIVLEISINAIPIRILHAPYIVLYGVAYIVWSVAYWGMDHSNILYAGVLDWNNPKVSALVSALLMFIGIPVLHFIFFGLYRLKLWIGSKCTRRI